MQSRPGCWRHHRHPSFMVLWTSLSQEFLVVLAVADCNHSRPPIREVYYCVTALAKCFEVIEAVLQLRPRRQFMMRRRQVMRVLVASDAALEPPRQLRIRTIPDTVAPGYESPVALVKHSSQISPEDLYDYWAKDCPVGNADDCPRVVSTTSRIQRTSGVWFIDNVASIMCLIRGRSDSAELEEICHFTHVVLFALKASLYWEYILSKPKWADPISRLGSNDPWHQREGFTRFSSFFNYRLLKLPLAAVIWVVQFL